jgi:hypothetical protein
MGKQLFNVSTFQKLSSYRIDDFILERIEASMATALRIREELHIELELNKDYQQLSTLKKNFGPRTLFYPKHRGEAAVDEKSPRLAGFLKHLDDHAYFSFYEYLMDQGRHLAFANPQELLKSLSTHGKTMQLVMTHVVMWLNDEPTKVNDREGNKPPLVDDLVLETSLVGLDSASTQARPVMGNSKLDLLRNSPARARQDKARAEALNLQWDVLKYVEEHAASFTDPGNKEYLKSMPDAQMDPLVYRERFVHGPWRHLLLTVYMAVGARFQNPCVTEFNDETGEAIAGLTGPASISLADSIQRIVTQHPEVARDRVLNNPEAIESLRLVIEKAVSDWRSNQQAQDIFGRCSNRGMLAEAVARAEVAQQRSSSVPQTSPTTPNDHLTSNLARSMFSKTEEQTPVTNRQEGVFPWSRIDLGRREAPTSGGAADTARTSVRRLAPHIPKVPSPLSQSTHHQTQERSPGRDENEHAISVVASKTRNDDRPTAVRKRQQKGGWRTKPPARG